MKQRIATILDDPESPSGPVTRSQIRLSQDSTSSQRAPKNEPQTSGSQGTGLTTPISQTKRPLSLLETLKQRQRGTSSVPSTRSSPITKTKSSRAKKTNHDRPKTPPQRSPSSPVTQVTTQNREMLSQLRQRLEIPASYDDLFSFEITPSTKKGKRSVTTTRSAPNKTGSSRPSRPFGVGFDKSQKLDLLSSKGSPLRAPISPRQDRYQEQNIHLVSRFNSNINSPREGQDQIDDQVDDSYSTMSSFELNPKFNSNAEHPQPPVSNVVHVSQSARQSRKSKTTKSKKDSSKTSSSSSKTKRTSSKRDNTFITKEVPRKKSLHRKYDESSSEEVVLRTPDMPFTRGVKGYLLNNPYLLPSIDVSPENILNIPRSMRKSRPSGSFYQPIDNRVIPLSGPDESHRPRVTKRRRSMLSSTTSTTSGRARKRSKKTHVSLSPAGTRDVVTRNINNNIGRESVPEQHTPEHVPIPSPPLQGLSEIDDYAPVSPPRDSSEAFNHSELQIEQPDFNADYVNVTSPQPDFNSSNIQSEHSIKRPEDRTLPKKRNYENDAHHESLMFAQPTFRRPYASQTLHPQHYRRVYPTYDMELPIPDHHRDSPSLESEDSASPSSGTSSSGNSTEDGVGIEKVSISPIPHSNVQHRSDIWGRALGETPYERYRPSREPEMTRYSVPHKRSSKRFNHHRAQPPQPPSPIRAPYISPRYRHSEQHERHERHERSVPRPHPQQYVPLQPLSDPPLSVDPLLHRFHCSKCGSHYFTHPPVVNNPNYMLCYSCSTQSIHEGVPYDCHHQTHYVRPRPPPPTPAPAAYSQAPPTQTHIQPTQILPTMGVPTIQVPLSFLQPQEYQPGRTKTPKRSRSRRTPHEQHTESESSDSGHYDRYSRRDNQSTRTTYPNRGQSNPNTRYHSTSKDQSHTIRRHITPVSQNTHGDRSEEPRRYYSSPWLSRTHLDTARGHDVRQTPAYDRSLDTNRGNPHHSYHSDYPSSSIYSPPMSERTNDMSRYPQSLHHTPRREQSGVDGSLFPMSSTMHNALNVSRSFIPTDEWIRQHADEITQIPTPILQPLV